jgi:cytochrome c oxidase subunit 2
MLGVFLVALVILSCWLFIQRTWWMPELASVHGVAIDRVFSITLVITGVMFILLQLVLAFFVVRFRQRGERKAQYSVRPRLEKRFALFAGIIIFSVDVTVFVLGDSEWFKAWGAAPDNPVVVEATSEQFVWNFRYPGADGVFGKTDPQLISTANTLGVDSADKASADDVLSINQLHIPEGRPVKLRLWKANTLEWTAPSPIPHGNWGSATPTVYRWPYEYSIPGAADDFLPQNVPAVSPTPK